MATNTKMPARGPYKTQAQARMAVDAFHARARAAAESDMRRAQVRLLLDTLAGIRVEAGNYDQLILAAIGQWEPETTAVLVGLLERAYAAGQQTGTTPSEVWLLDHEETDEPPAVYGSEQAARGAAEREARGADWPGPFEWRTGMDWQSLRSRDGRAGWKPTGDRLARVLVKEDAVVDLADVERAQDGGV